METQNGHMPIEDTKFHKKRFVKGVLIGIATVVVILVIFQAGVFVGYKKAGFIDRELFHDDIPGGHGVVGKVIKISPPSIVIEGPDNMEKVIMTDDDTAIRRSRESITLQDIGLDDRVVIIGSPDDKGQIVAKLIRIYPLLSTSTNQNK